MPPSGPALARRALSRAVPWTARLRPSASGRPSAVGVRPSDGKKWVGSFGWTLARGIRADARASATGSRDASGGGLGASGAIDGAGEEAGAAASIDEAPAASSPSPSAPLCVLRPMPSRLVLGIETSCDDTGVALVRGDGTVLASRVFGQAAVHERWGGVVPTLAAAAHADALAGGIAEVLREGLGGGAAGREGKRGSGGDAGATPSSSSSSAASPSAPTPPLSSSALSLSFSPPDASAEPSPKPSAPYVRPSPIAISALAPPFDLAAELDAVAVTVGPGLSLCLKQGLRAAMQLASGAGVPLVRVHHMEAHALVGRLPFGDTCDEERGRKEEAQKEREEKVEASGSLPSPPPPFPPFPFLALLASGGHCLAVVVRDVGSYVQLGTTLDDAPGEAFDKVGRELGFGSGGGAAVEAAARLGDASKYPFREPLLRRKATSCDFSFAGLKTGVRVKRDALLAAAKAAEGERQGKEGASVGEKSDAAGGLATPEGASSSTFPSSTSPLFALSCDLAASFQKAAVAHLARGVRRALTTARAEFPTLSAVVFAGGVARNGAAREALEREAARAGVPLVAPPLELCADNGVMVAWAAHQMLERQERGAAGGAGRDAEVVGSGKAEVGSETARMGSGSATAPSTLALPPCPSPPEEDWRLDVRPRWPLTSDVRGAGAEGGRSMRSARLFESLTAMMRDAEKRDAEAQRAR